MAVEEMCRHAESGRYDLIVLDTPPSAHALDFVSAPGRIDQLFDRRIAQWFAGGAWRTAGAAARFLFRRLETATGAATLREIAAFFAALEALVETTLARTRRARALLRGGDAAFVLVAAPRQLAIEETAELAAKLRAQPTPLAALVFNRVHALPAIADLEARLAALGDDAPARWLRAAWTAAAGEVEDERAVIARFTGSLPAGIPVHTVPEAAHDLHALVDLEHVVAALSDPE
jgi:anion-transporting  ArsA/GET3 family ATPase